MVESMPRVLAALQANAELIGATAGAVEIRRGDALQYLASTKAKFDLIFLDPPFAGDLWRPALSLLPPWLASDAWLYLESPHDAAIDPGPDWRAHREGSTRDVRFALYRRAS